MAFCYCYCYYYCFTDYYPGLPISYVKFNCEFDFSMLGYPHFITAIMCICVFFFNVKLIVLKYIKFFAQLKMDQSNCIYDT